MARASAQEPFAGWPTLPTVRFHNQCPTSDTHLALTHIVWGIARFCNERWRSAGIRAQCLTPASDRCWTGWGDDTADSMECGFTVDLGGAHAAPASSGVFPRFRRTVSTIAGLCAMRLLLGRRSLAMGDIELEGGAFMLRHPASLVLGARSVPGVAAAAHADGMSGLLTLGMQAIDREFREVVREVITTDERVGREVVRKFTANGNDDDSGTSTTTVSQEGSRAGSRLKQYLLGEVWAAVNLFSPTAHPSEHTSLLRCLRGLVSPVRGGDVAWAVGAFADPATAHIDAGIAHVATERQAVLDLPLTVSASLDWFEQQTPVGFASFWRSFGVDGEHVSPRAGPDPGWLATRT